MNKEELIEVLRQFDEKRVEELPEKTRNIFYAIMKIADERDELENIRKKAIEYVYKHIQEYDVDGTFTNLDEFDFIASPQTLLNILNKGDKNE